MGSVGVLMVLVLVFAALDDRCLGVGLGLGLGVGVGGVVVD